MTDDKGNDDKELSCLIGEMKRIDSELYNSMVTDDKGAREGLYRHSTYGHATCDLTKCLACAYASGRKAERERCAKIAEGYFNARGRVVAKAIRGGQDAK